MRRSQKSYIGKSIIFLSKLKFLELDIIITNP